MKNLFDLWRKKDRKKNSAETVTEIDLKQLSRFTTYHNQKPLSPEEYERIMKLIDGLE